MIRGKSNILEALGNMSFTHYINTEFFSKKIDIQKEYSYNIRIKIYGK